MEQNKVAPNRLGLCKGSGQVQGVPKRSKCFPRQGREEHRVTKGFFLHSTP